MLEASPYDVQIIEGQVALVFLGRVSRSSAPKVGGEPVSAEGSRCHDSLCVQHWPSRLLTQTGFGGNFGNLWMSRHITVPVNKPRGLDRDPGASSPALLVKQSRDETLSLTCTNRMLRPERQALIAP